MRRAPRFIILGFVLLIGGVAAAFWIYLNKDPVVSIPTPRLPSPNAFDDFVAAGDLVVKSPVMDKPEAFSRAEREAVLRRSAPALARLRKGLGRPYLHPPARSLSAGSPHLARFQRMAHLLRLEALIHEERGEWEAAMQSRLDCLQFGSAIPRGATLIGMLTGVATEVFGRLDAGKDVDHLTAMQARRAAGRLQRIIESQVPLADVMQEEKWSVQASLLEAFRSPDWRTMNLGGPRASGRVPDPRVLFLSKRRVMANFTAAMDEGIVQAGAPYAPAPTVPSPSRDPFTDALLPPFGRARFHHARARTFDSLLLQQIALRAHYVDHKRYPQRLEGLVPAYLVRLPADPFAAKGGFAYRTAGAQYVLYSVGPDRKDDGGRPANSPFSANRYIVDMDAKGDVVAGVSR